MADSGIHFATSRAELAERRARENEVLRAAAGLVLMGWSQGAQARNAAGELTPSTADDAVAWCMLGATYRAARDLFGPRFSIAVGPRWTAMGFRFREGCTAAEWNDRPGRTAAEVAERLLALAGTT